MEKHYDTAEDCINGTAIDAGAGSPEAFYRALEEEAKNLEAAEQAQVESYISGTREALQTMIIRPLDPGIGGVYDGSTITMATSTLMVGESIDSTMAQIEETAKHEKFHRDNDHLDPMMLGSSAEGENVVRIGGNSFTDKGMFEALTVHNTGNSFVSTEYINYEQRLANALIRATLDWDDVAEALNEKKDYRLLDDRDRERAKGEAVVMA